MNKKKFEQDGTPVSSRRLYEERLVQAAELMLRFEDMWSRYDEQDCTILDVRVKCPGLSGGQYFVVCRAVLNRQPAVAFSSGDSFQEAVRVFLARLENGTLAWKEDKYAKQG